MTRYPLVPVVIVTTLVVSSVAAGAGVATGPADASASPTDGSFIVSEHDNESVPPADAVYVSDSGDVVVEYEASDTNFSQFRLSGDMTQGLLYAFGETMESDELRDVTGNASLQLMPTELAANGDLTTPKPEAIRNLSVRADGAITREEAYTDISFNAAGASEGASTAQFIESLSTTGTYEITGDDVSVSSTYSAEYAVNPVGSEMSHEFTLEETEGGFTVEADQSFSLPPSDAQAFATEESARQTLSLVAGELARELGGEATVELHEHAYDDSGPQPTITMAYTVTVTGVREMLMQSIATGLAADNPDISQGDAEEIVSEVDDLRLAELAGSLDVGETAAEAEWSVSITGYDALVDAAAAYAERAETQPQTVASIEQTRKQLALQQETGLVTRLSWDATLAFGPEVTRVTGDSSYTTDNWDAYVAALEEEAMGLDGETEFTVSVTDTDAGELYSEAAFTVQQEAFVDGMMQSIQTDGGSDLEAQQVVRALERADFDRISADASIADQTVTIEAGAAFANGTGLQDALRTVYGDALAIEQFYGGTDTGAMHIHISDAVDDPTDERAVRELIFVGEETNIFLPGEWDEESQSFGQAANDAAAEYLGVDIGDGTDGTDGDGNDGTDGDSGSQGDEDDASGSGFGVGVAVVIIALLVGGGYYSRE